MRSIPAILVSTLLLAAGCNDDGVRAADYDGLWLITSITIPGDDGDVTLSRDGGAQAIRGDGLFVASDDTHATLDVRQVLLAEGLIASEIQTVDTDVLVEEGRWVLTDDDGEVTVFTAELAEDRLVLALDPDDPRGTALEPPTEVVLDRAEPWSGRLVGDWELVSMELPSAELVADTCFEVEPDVWVTVTMDIAIDERLLFERTMKMIRWTDGSCTVPADEQESQQVGLAEDDADTLAIWGSEEGNAEYQEFSVATSGDEATLTRTGCLPLPECEDEAPIEVVVRRAP